MSEPVIGRRWQIIDGAHDSHGYALATGPEELFASLGDGTLL